MAAYEEVESFEIGEEKPICCGLPYKVNYYHTHINCQYVRRAVREGRIDDRIQDESKNIDMIEYHELELCSECNRKNSN